MGILKSIKESFSKKESLSLDSEAKRKFLAVVGFGNQSLRTSQFISDLFSENILTPHEEMRQAEILYRTNSHVASGVEMLVNVTLGDKFKATSDDTTQQGITSATFHNDFTMRKIKKPFIEAVEGFWKAGNGYIEILRNKSNQIIGFRAISNPERMYVDYTGNFRPSCYVLEMPRNMRGPNIKDHTVNYMGEVYKKQVYGIRFELNEILHLKNGVSHLPVYGRSELASCVNDSKILKELERNSAVIARFKSIAKKILSARSVEEGTTIDEESRERVKRDIENSADFENLFLPNVDLDVKDLGYAGQHVDNSNMFNYFSRKVTAPLAPSFYMHGDSTPYSVSRDQKNLFFLKIMNKRDIIKEPIVDLMREMSLARKMSTDIDIEFGNFDFPTKEEKSNMAREQFKDGVITLNEAREILDLEPVPESKDGGIGDAYYWELTDKNEMQDLFNSMQSKKNHHDDFKETEDSTSCGCSTKEA